MNLRKVYNTYRRLGLYELENHLSRYLERFRKEPFVKPIVRLLRELIKNKKDQNIDEQIKGSQHGKG